MRRVCVSFRFFMGWSVVAAMVPSLALAQGAGILDAIV